MHQRALSETDIRTKFSTPAPVEAKGEKWDPMTWVREEAYFTKGRVIVRGRAVRRGEAKRTDYLLLCKPNLPLAVVEAKDNTHSIGDGMAQAIECAEALDVPFAYSSDGDAFLEHDRTAIGDAVTRGIPLGQRNPAVAVLIVLHPTTLPAPAGPRIDAPGLPLTAQRRMVQTPS